MIDAYRTVRQTMLRKIAEEQREREYLARLRESTPAPCERIAMTVLIAASVGLIAWLLMGQP